MRIKNSKEKNLLNTVLLIIKIICIIIFIISLVYIFMWYIENKKNSDILKNAKDSSIIDTRVIQVQITDDSTLSTENSNEAQVSNKTIEIPVYELDFNKLLSINDSTVCWLKVPNTSIDYPVVKATDNSFYLNHSFDKSKNTAGWIFADYRNKFDGTDKNIIIYGHNRVDTSMFATLKNTQKNWWYNNINNRYITLTTPTGTFVYEVFSTYTIPMESYYMTTDFWSDSEYISFLETIKSRSIYDFGIQLNSSDKILTLSTCDASGKSRVVVHARKLN